MTWISWLGLGFAALTSTIIVSSSREATRSGRPEMVAPPSCSRKSFCLSTLTVKPRFSYSSVQRRSSSVCSIL